MGAGTDPSGTDVPAASGRLQVAVGVVVTLLIAGVGTYLCVAPGGASDPDTRTWDYVFSMPFRIVGLGVVGIIAGLVGGGSLQGLAPPYVGFLVAVAGYVCGAVAAIAGQEGYADLVMPGAIPFGLAAGVGAWAVGRK